MRMQCKGDNITVSAAPETGLIAGAIHTAPPHPTRRRDAAPMYDGPIHRATARARPLSVSRAFGFFGWGGWGFNNTPGRKPNAIRALK
jgi:hypothetical protein